MIPRRTSVSPEAGQKFAADQALAARFDELLTEARTAEQELRDGEAANVPSRHSAAPQRAVEKAFMYGIPFRERSTPGVIRERPSGVPDRRRRSG